MEALTPFYFYLILAVVLISLELIIFQLSIFWFLFIGVGALQASLVVWLMGSDSWVVATAVFVSASIVSAAALYRPLMRWQKKPGVVSGNTAVGQQVLVTEAIAVGKAGKVHWSGTDWVAQLAEDHTASIEVGSHAVIIKLEGIRLLVGPA